MNNLKIFTFISSLFFLETALADFESCKNTNGAVETALVLSVDVSVSIDDYEFDLQKQGYLEALNDPEVLDIVSFQRCVSIGVVLWSGSSIQAYPLTKISSFEEFSKLKNSIENWRLQNMLLRLVHTDNSYIVSNFTNISAGLNRSIEMLKDYKADNKVIDVSGDGYDDRDIGVDLSQSNLEKARQRAISHSIEINGLPIEDMDYYDISSEESLSVLVSHGHFSLSDYYEKDVITPYGFVETAQSFYDFGESLKRKIRRELAPLMFKSSQD